MNVQRGRGKVHATDTTPGFLAGPACGGNLSAEGYRKTTAAVDCKKCLTILAKADDKGETMAAKKDETTTTAAKPENDAKVDQITANIERARSLAEAENTEGLAALNKETEELISSLPTRGKAGDSQTWAQAKQAFRNSFREAATLTAKEEPTPTTAVVVVETRDYKEAAGVSELVTLGAEKFADGVRVHLKAADLAKDVARVLLDMRVRMLDKEGRPDILAKSHGAKQASKDMYASAGQMFLANNPEASKFDAKQAVNKLIKSVQNQMPTVRAEYLRELDNDAAEAKRFEGLALPAGVAEDAPLSTKVAAAYEVELVSRYELDKARSENGEDDETTANGGGNGGGNGAPAEVEPQTPAQVIGAFFASAEESVTAAEQTLKEANDAEAKEAAKARIDALIAHLATVKAGL